MTGDNIFGWIIEGFCGALTSLINWVFAEALQIAATDNSDTFTFVFPGIEGFFLALKTISATLVIVLALISLIKGMFIPNSAKVEHPIKLVAMTGLSLTAILYSDAIFDYIMRIKDALVTPVNDAAASVLISNGAGETVGGLLGATGALAAGLAIPATSGVTLLATVASFIMGLTIIINLIRLVVEIVERYIVLNVLRYTSPLIFSTIASANTRDIFASWCRMLCGEIILIIMNVWSITLFTNAVLNASAAIGNGIHAITWTIFMVAFLRVAQHMDNILQRLNINVATTGGSMVSELLAVVNVARLVSRIGSGVGGLLGRVGGTGATGGGTGVVGGTSADAVRSAVGAASSGGKGRGFLGTFADLQSGKIQGGILGAAKASAVNRATAKASAAGDTAKLGNIARANDRRVSGYDKVAGEHTGAGAATMRAAGVLGVGKSFSKAESAAYSAGISSDTASALAGGSVAAHNAETYDAVSGSPDELGSISAGAGFEDMVSSGGGSIPADDGGSYRFKLDMDSVQQHDDGTYSFDADVRHIDPSGRKTDFSSVHFDAVDMSKYSTGAAQDFAGDSDMFEENSWILYSGNNTNLGDDKKRRSNPFAALGDTAEE